MNNLYFVSQHTLILCALYSFFKLLLLTFTPRSARQYAVQFAVLVTSSTRMCVFIYTHNNISCYYLHNILSIFLLPRKYVRHFREAAQERSSPTESRNILKKCRIQDQHYFSPQFPILSPPLRVVGISLYPHPIYLHFYVNSISIHSLKRYQ